MVTFKYYIQFVLGVTLFVLASGAGTAHADSDKRQSTLSRVKAISLAVESNKTTVTDFPQKKDFNNGVIQSVEDLDIYENWLSKKIENSFETVTTSELNTYEEAASRLNNTDHSKISQILITYMNLKETGTDAASSKEYLSELELFQNDTDWYVANRAYYFQALAYLHSLNYNASLNASLSALNLVPEGQSIKISEAAYDANSLASGIYSYLGNIDMAAKTVEIHIEQSQALGRDIDGLSILNNFGYMLTKWGEYETAKDIAETSIRLSQKQSPITQIRAQYRHAQALNGLQRYGEALEAAETGIALGPTGSWKLNLQSQLAIAQAGAGETQSALVTLGQIESLAKSDPKYMKRYGTSIRETRALLAANDNNPMEVFRLMQENQIQATQKLLRNNSDDTQKLMGTLSNAKELQRAKEKELNLQNTLKQERIDAQARDAVKMKIIIALLSITAAGIGIFALQQRRVSAREIVLRKQADIGEKAKRDFLAVMSHELRTPLNGIIGLSEILSRQGPTEDVKFKNGVIYKSGLNLLDLLTNILDMSKMEGGKVGIERAPANIRDLVNSLGALWMSKAIDQEIAFTLSVDDTVPERLLVDALRLRQCLENLISNALKFTQSGSVEVHVSYLPHRKTEKSVLTLVVTDTGPGMPAEKATEVFMPFTQADVSITRQFGGSGLGLAITHNLAQLMGGGTTVKSVVGQGSEFTLTVTAGDPVKVKKQHLLTSEVTLRPSIKENLMAAEAQFNAKTEPKNEEYIQPESTASSEVSKSQDLAPPPALPSTSEIPAIEVPETPAETQITAAPQNIWALAPNAALTALAPPPFPEAGPQAIVRPKPKSKAQSADVFKGIKVLVVEDIASNRDVLKIFLGPVGCQVSVAENGREALETLSSERFDIVLMDVRMPIMDGIEATQALRASAGPNRDVAVIALTADASPMSNAKCMAAGADVFLTKPVVADELFGAMRFVLAQSRLRRAKAMPARDNNFATAIDAPRLDVKGVA